MQEAASSSQSNFYSSSSGFSLSNSVRYAGMIQDSAYKQMRNALFSLFDYVAQTSPPFWSVHSVVGIWRVFLTFSPSFCAGYKILWHPDSAIYKMNQVLSVLSSIVPVGSSALADDIFLWVCTGIFLIGYIVGLSSAMYLQKNAKLNNVIVIMIGLFFPIASYILPPMMAFTEFRLVSHIIVDPKQYATLFNILSIAINILVFLIFLWLFSEVYAISITFKPDSLMTITPAATTLLGVLPIIYAIILGIGTNFPLYPAIACQLLGAVVYFGSVFLLFFQGGLVKKVHQQLVGASFIAGGTMLILDVILEFLHIYATILNFCIYIAVWNICYLFFNWFMDRRTNKILNILDTVDQNEEDFQLFFKTPYKLLDYAVIGFRYAHPVCLNLKIFKYAIETWPKNVTVWFLYGKFMAIYPEETSQLEFISNGVMSNRLKGPVAKHMVSQVHMIFKQRESNLIPDLKSKLDKINKQVVRTRSKIRYVWDLILQGHIGELESALASAYTAIEKNHSEFLHMLNVYSNSRFVARAYARFLRDILSDDLGYQEWSKNASLLQRGISVMIDQAHDLGILAFPNLPAHLNCMPTSALPVSNTFTDDTFGIEIDVDEDQAQSDAEVKNSIRESIDKLKVPAYKLSRWLTFLVLFILSFGVVLALTIYILLVANQMKEPLSYLYDTSCLRTYMFQSIGYSFHLAGENVDDPDWVKFKPPMPPEDANGENISSTNSTAILLSLLDRITKLQPALSGLMSYRSNDPNMDLVRNILFNSAIEAHVMDVNGVPNTQNVSIFDLLSLVVSSLLELVQYDHLDATIFKSRILYNAIMNIQTSSSSMTECINKTINMIEAIEKEIIAIIRIIMYVVISCDCVSLAAVCFVVITTIGKNKSAVYVALTMLPKQVISQVAESCKVVKKYDDDDDEDQASQHIQDDLNRQEENMIKIFSATNSSMGATSDVFAIIVFLVIVTILNLGSSLYMIKFIKTSSETMTHLATHLDSISASYSYDFVCQVILLMISANNCNPASDPMKFTVGIFTTPFAMAVFDQSDKQASRAYAELRYGKSQNDVVPYSTLGSGLLNNGIISDSCNENRSTTTLHQAYRCFYGDTLVGYVKFVSQNLLAEQKGGIMALKGDNQQLTHLWHITSHHLYDNYYYPMFSSIESHVKEILNANVPHVLIGGWIMCVISIIFGCTLIYILNMSEERLKYGLRLLLQVPNIVVLSNSALTSMINGNFSKRNIGYATRDDTFFDNLVDELPDAVITYNNDGVIKKINQAGKRLFQIEEDLDGSLTITDFSSKWGHQDLNFKNNFESEIVINNNKGEELHLQLVNTSSADSSILTIRDITQTFMYNKLIEEECNKCNKFLASILPPALVSRVQAGEKNISFSVQSATITFMDIVSFTPWCGSNSAEYVMKTLNTIYKYFDENCNKQSTMTKIKCIGDCYMAAGGIFMEVNQPSVHSKEVVEFGLDCITSINRINAELLEHLQIRVGINTGGPIVAGVIGTTKPTFEILGPAIQMAQQMEHNGIPMKVHISRPVYELIYGGTFNVKERGEIEVKNGRVVTYIVS